ncbi:hypothetical protein SAMN05444170_4770 [Bradyrhizobium erythrophlei]|uniref:Uncharacterized protein n=2 Tax=Bradyrhizobium erythrophlei TaxID=1437360 RepID=A0A1M7UF55_9BRAD|nr:hypothetical protein SAMN05444170_4770 [Bradyrhizobium erythrophlei]
MVQNETSRLRTMLCIAGRTMRPIPLLRDAAVRPLLRMRPEQAGKTTMALIRIEPKLDASSGLYCVEIFHPAEAEQPFVTTEPRYKTAAAAENDVIAIIASRANSAKA